MVIAAIIGTLVIFVGAVLLMAFIVLERQRDKDSYIPPKPRVWR